MFCINKLEFCIRKYAYYFFSALAQIKGFIFTDLAIKLERKRFSESKQIEFPSGLSKNNIVGRKGSVGLLLSFYDVKIGSEYSVYCIFFGDNKISAWRLEWIVQFWDRFYWNKLD